MSRSLMKEAGCCKAGFLSMSRRLNPFQASWEWLGLVQHPRYPMWMSAGLTHLGGLSGSQLNQKSASGSLKLKLPSCPLLQTSQYASNLTAQLPEGKFAFRRPSYTWRAVAKVKVMQPAGDGTKWPNPLAIWVLSSDSAQHLGRLSHPAGHLISMGIWS